MRAIRLILPFGLCSLALPTHAQSWAEGMLDQEAGFFEVRDAFNAHWQARPYERRSGGEATGSR